MCVLSLFYIEVILLLNIANIKGGGRVLTINSVETLM